MQLNPLEKKNKGFVVIEGKELDKPIDFPDLYFEIGYLLLVLGKSLGFTSAHNIYHIMFGISLIFFTLSVFLKKYSYREIISITVLGGIGIASFLSARTTNFLFTIIILVSSKGISVVRILKHTLIVQIIGTVGITLLTALGIHKGLTHTIMNEVHFAFGYATANLYAISWFVMILLFLFLVREKGEYSRKYIFLSILSIVICTLLTGCRTVLFSLILFWCLVLLSYVLNRSKTKRMFRMCNIMLCGLPLILSVFSIWAGYAFSYNSKIWTKVDAFATGRFNAAYRYLQILSPTVFGNIKVHTHTSEISEIIDNAYVFLYVNCGVVGIGCFVLMVTCTLLGLYQNKKYTLVFILATLLITGIVEQFTINAVTNPFLLYCTLAIFQDGKKEERL